MAQDQLNESEAILDSIVTTPYKYGFTTDVETEEFEKGLNKEIVKKISSKKNEPEFLLKFREKAFISWQKIPSHISVTEIRSTFLMQNGRSPNGRSPEF